ncbi:MAG: LysM peptidoglycan-binding domain-containing protein [Treponema sp.]|nr:LysM peptidoglycan-binding domain-containing protein [Treponema sp.]
MKATRTSKRTFAAMALILLFGTGMALHAAEGDIQALEYVNVLLNNPYLVENARLTALAEECYAGGKYDDAIRYATEAIQYAEKSDEYVATQMRMKEANDAIARAEARLEWARNIGAPRRFAETYGSAEAAFAEALDARSREDWTKAKDSALRVLAILETLPSEQVLPAQYRVKTWVRWKDCLWNIAGKPEIYGNPWMWRHIYNANRSKLPQPNNPDLIRPGMVLDIPSIRGEVRAGIMEE